MPWTSLGCMSAGAMQPQAKGKFPQEMHLLELHVSKGTFSEEIK